LNYSLEGSYNPLTGTVGTVAEVEDTRYGLLPYYFDGSQDTGKGTVGQSPFGSPYAEVVIQTNPAAGVRTVGDKEQALLEEARAPQSTDRSQSIANPQSAYINGGGAAQPVGGLTMAGADRLAQYADYAKAQYLQSCFAAGTPIKTATGTKLAEDVEVGDWLWSRSEFDPDGPLELKEVEERFVRVAPIVNLHIGGQIIRTTPEHPFYKKGEGWVPCKTLSIGDFIRLDGGWGEVKGLGASGEVVTVYNWRIADWHTYFVGSGEWGFAVWAHNVDVDYSADGLRDLAAKTGMDKQKLKDMGLTDNQVTKARGLARKTSADPSDPSGPKLLAKSKHPGCRGTDENKDDLDNERDKIMADHPNWKHLHGGRDAVTGEDKPEKAVNGPNGEKVLPDLTFKKGNGRMHYHQQVSTTADGETPDSREQGNLDTLEDIKKPGDTISHSPKPSE
jgi:hypothetical protein